MQYCMFCKEGNCHIQDHLRYMDPYEKRGYGYYSAYMAPFRHAICPHKYSYFLREHENYSYYDDVVHYKSCFCGKYNIQGLIQKCPVCKTNSPQNFGLVNYAFCDAENNLCYDCMAEKRDTPCECLICEMKMQDRWYRYPLRREKDAPPPDDLLRSNLPSMEDVLLEAENIFN